MSIPSNFSESKGQQKILFIYSYLPPPVLVILSDKTLEATKRAAMITAALTWIFNNLPVNALPPAVRPAAILLQRIVPYLGYIGTFIAWSWSTIKSYDVGGSFQQFLSSILYF